MVAAAGAGVYLLVLIALPVLQPGFDVLRTHPEDYAGGQFGVLVNLGYAALALALAAIVAALWSHGGWGRAGQLLLLLAAALSATLAVRPTLAVRGSAAVTVGVLGLALGPLISTIALRARLHPWHKPVIALGIAVAAAFVGLVVAPQAVGGAVNRLFDLLAGGWLLLVGLRAYRSP